MERNKLFTTPAGLNGKMKTIEMSASTVGVFKMLSAGCFARHSCIHFRDIMTASLRISVLKAETLAETVLISFPEMGNVLLLPASRAMLAENNKRRHNNQP